MNKDLQEAIKIYSIGSRKELNAFLLDKSKDNLIAIFNDLLTTYIDDKNSSTIREFITTIISGYTHHETKIGYNGYRQKTISGINEYCEVKPKNVDRLDLEKYKNGEKKSIQKLNAGGNFTDYTWERFDKDFICNLKRQLEKAFPNRQRKIGTFLRSASFDFKSFIFSDDFKINFLLSKNELEIYKEFFNRNFYLELIRYAK